MNEQTTKLIEALASKLGTTAEHLWGVLMRQAPISASMDLVGSLVLAAALVYGWKWRARLIREETDKEWGTWASDAPPSIISAVILGGASLVLPLTVAFNLDNTIAGFFNPEYWALMKVLSFGK